MNLARPRLLALVGVFALFGSAAAAQTPNAPREPFTAEAMWKLARVGDPSISPDGRRAVVPVTRFDIAADRGLTDLYVIPTDGGPAQRLTSARAGDTEPRWSPDGRWIAFVSRRDDDRADQLYVISPDGGEARRLTSVPTGVRSPRWFPDSQRLAFVSHVWPDLDGWEAQDRRLKERAERRVSARVWDRGPVTEWDRFVDDREFHIFSVGLGDGAAPARVTQGSGFSLDFDDPLPPLLNYDISPDGREIAFTANVDRTGRASNYDILVVPATGGTPRNLTEGNRADDDEPRYSPDGRWLAFTQQRIPGFYADRERLMLHDRARSATRELFPDWDRSAAGLVWTPDSRALLGSIDDAAVRRVYRFDVAGGTPRRITDRPDVGALAVGGSTVVGLRQSFSEPPTLVRLDLRTGGTTALSRFNDAALARAALGPVESVTYKGAEGADIQMWVIKPPGFDPARRYPAFLLLHGGPHNGVTEVWQWRWNAQVFANLGYVVAWHNFHGSSGFGQAFTDSINPNWADKPYADTIAAADWLAAQPWVDRSRMVAGGGSYGGYLASVLLGRPHPFRALIAHAPVYNRFTQIASDGGNEPDRFFEFWENPADFARFSPHTNAGSFNTPTLVIHGQLDYRVPVNHAVELFQTLQRRRVDSRLVYFPDENHWILKPQNSIFWYDEVEAWITRHAPPAAPPPGAAG